MDSGTENSDPTPLDVERHLGNRSRHVFGVADYCVFAGMLLISALIGVYHACRGGKQRTNREFLMANRQMGAVPVAFSLLASFMSAIILTGMPSEVYARGAEFMLIGVGFLCSLPLASYFFLPIYFRIGITSAYEYLELRFNSKVPRILGSFLFILQTLLYMGIVVYAPSLAVNAVTGFPIWASILSAGAICTFYTTIGGMKAVIWTDVFQTCIMYAGILACIIQGSKLAGGLDVVWQRAVDGGRFDNFHTDSSPFVYQTVWGLIIGIAFNWTGVYGISQSAVQRYCSMRSLREARIAVLLNVPGLASIVLLTGLAGLVVYANYGDCDPLAAGVIKKDQILPYFVVDTLGFLPGFSGLFVSCLFSGALSTVSSGLNSLAAVVWEDMLKPFYGHLPETRITYITKALSVLFGAFSIAVAFAAQNLGGVVQATGALTSSAMGPLLGLFILAVLFPWVGWRGAVMGTLVSFGLMGWICIGAQINLKTVASPFLPTSQQGCSWNHPNNTFAARNASSEPPFNVHSDWIFRESSGNGGVLDEDGELNSFLQDELLYTGRKPLSLESEATALTVSPPFRNISNDPNTAADVSDGFKLYHVSYLWYTPMGVIITVVIAILSSPFLDMMFRKRREPVSRTLITPICYDMMCCLPETHKVRRFGLCGAVSNSGQEPRLSTEAEIEVWRTYRSKDNSVVPAAVHQQIQEMSNMAPPPPAAGTGGSSTFQDGRLRDNGPDVSAIYRDGRTTAEAGEMDASWEESGTESLPDMSQAPRVSHVSSV